MAFGNITEALLALLPKGPAWTRDIDTVMRSLFEGIAVEYGRVQARLEQAALEIDAPSSATETIADWEEMVGLPSDCTEIAGTLEERRVEAQRRWVRCGQWTDSIGAEFLEARIVELGYDAADVTIYRFHFEPMTCESECDDYLNSEDAGWLCVYEFVIISLDDEHDQRAICEIEKRYLHGAYGATFAFPLLEWSDGTFTRAGSAVLHHPETLIESALAGDEAGEFFFGY